MIPMEMGVAMEDLLGADHIMVRALNLNGAFTGNLGDIANDRDFRAAELPAANGVTNARSLARMYAGLVGTVEGGPSEPLLTREQIDAARTLQTSGPDRVLTIEGMEVMSTIALGFWRASEFAPMGGAGAFGHYGAGGSLGVADPESGIAMGYVMSRMDLGIAGDPRSGSLIRTTYECAGAPIAYI